jgi:4-amino-4-deoxy-L-arabinose transferase-like glycosyltransferase
MALPWLALGFWIPAVAGVLLLHGHHSVLGWGCVAAGVVWALAKPAWPAGARTAPALTARAEGIWLAAIVLLAIVLRWWGLESVPPGCWFDEAQNALETLHILKGEWFFFTPRNNGRGALQFFWTAPFFQTFGATVGSLRLASAVMGAATVPLVWLLGRKLAGAWAGLFAAAFLACSYWHVSVSRLGFDAVMTPAFDAAMLVCLLLALETASWVWFAAAGLLVGVANYSYAASRASLLLLAAAMALALILPLRSAPGNWQRYRRGVLAAGLAALIVLAPLLSLAIRQPALLSQRGSQVLVGSSDAALRNLRATLRMFLERGDANPRHNLPGRPMLDPVVGVLALGGLVLAWRRRREFPFQLAVVWLGVYTVLAGMLTDAAPHGLRMLSTVIPASLLAAWGLEQGLADFRLSSGRWRGAALALMLAALGSCTAYAYFKVYAHHPATRPAFSPHAYEVGRFLRTLPAGTLVQVSRRFDQDVVAFISGRKETVLALDFSLPAGQADPWVRIMQSPEEAPWFMQAGAYTWREIKTPQGERFWVCERR